MTRTIHVPEDADVETVHSIMSNLHKMARGRRNDSRADTDS